uniref:COP9 signalosome complex subunit 4 n=1 Tax=Palpitomonas bilix TaxID=652834 RepID=A0A7S3GG87_9EUKA|mmetsp:Transcript_47801/g.124028  ORF Transcript_47801/g.124028 Transcript_47801/m.124028 type:complete len:407 (+) Transcript_47801:295-1515(+)
MEEGEGQAALLSALEAFSRAVEPKEKTEAGCTAVDLLLKAQDRDGTKKIAAEVLSENFPLVSARPIMLHIAEKLSNAENEFKEEVGPHILRQLKARAATFEEAISLFCELMSEVYQASEEWRRAAEVLAEIPLSSGIRAIDDEYKLKTLLHIAQLYLEDDDPVQAEEYVQRATPLVQSVTNVEQALVYKFCYVRILDTKRRFLEAASQYYDLSLPDRLGDLMEKISSDELLETLSNACTCAILAPAGPKRSRILGLLHKDERSSSLPLFPVLEKMYLERMLQKDEVAMFQETLKPHQLALLGDGSTVLDKAVMEHNIRSAGLIYNSVKFEQLGDLLGLTADKVATAAAQMIAEDRLNGTIDEPLGILAYDSGSAAKIKTWNKLIENACSAVSTIADIIQPPESSTR